MKNKKSVIITGVIAIVLIIAMIFVYNRFSEKPVEGSKEITIEVIDDEEVSVTYTVKTDAEYLREAMDEAEGLTYTGSEGDYGMMVESVNEVTANYDENGAYWSFYINGEYCNYSIDQQPINDGDNFQIIYTVQ